MLYVKQTYLLKMQTKLLIPILEKAHNELSREMGENLTLIQSQIFL